MYVDNFSEQHTFDFTFLVSFFPDDTHVSVMFMWEIHSISTTFTRILLHLVAK